MTVNIGQLAEPLVYAYRYDQLNRLTRMDAYRGLSNTTNILTPSTIVDYKEKINYDPNGNILSYLRNGTFAGSKLLGMDNLGYTYKAGPNQLVQVTDAVHHP